MKTFRTIILTVVVTVVVMIGLAYRFGFITAKADVETYKYETYCNGTLIDRHYENEVRGTNLSIDVNKKVYLSK